MSAPKFSELFHAGRIDEVFRLAQRSSKLIFWSTSPLLLAFILVGGDILQILYGSEFSTAYPALVILAAGQFVNSACGSNGVFMNMTGQERIFSGFVFIAALISVGLYVLLIPSMGVNGAALGATASLVLWNLATLVFIKGRFGQSTGYLPFSGWLLRPLGPSPERRG